MSACSVCDVYQAYQTHATTVLDRLTDAVAGPLTVIVIALAGVWILWVGIQMFVGTLDLAGALKQIFFLAFGFGVFLGVSGGMVGEVFQAAVDVMGDLSATIMGEGGGAGGMTALLSVVEEAIRQVFNTATVIMGSGSAWDSQFYLSILYGIALLIPYMLLLILFLAHSAVALLRLTLICGLSPLLVALSAFPFGRNLIGAGVRTVIGSITTMLCVTTVFSIVVSSVTDLGIGAEDNMNPSEYIDFTSGRIILALVMGWLGAALTSEAVNIAGQVANSVLGSVSAGIVAAGAMRGGSLTASGARTAAGFIGDMGTANRERMWSKPRPGGMISSGS